MTCPLRAFALEEGLVRHYAQETRVAGRGRSIGWIGNGSESGGTEAEFDSAGHRTAKTTWDRNRSTGPQACSRLQKTWCKKRLASAWRLCCQNNGRSRPA